MKICLPMTAFVLAGCISPPVDVTTSSPVSYALRVEIREGQQDAFRALMAEMVASTKAERGTLVYEWFLADDGRTCTIREHFVDTAAYKEHSDNFGKHFADRFLPLVEIQGMTVFGNADDEARERLSGLAPRYLKAIGGFRR